MHEILHCVQNDIRGIFVIATQPLQGEEISEITEGDKSISLAYRLRPHRTRLEPFEFILLLPAAAERAVELYHRIQLPSSRAGQQ